MQISEKPLYKVFVTFVLALLIPCAAADAVSIIAAPKFDVLSFGAVFSAAALVAAFLYTVRGYSKRSAEVYKSFISLYLVSMLCGVLSAALTEGPLGRLVLLLAGFVLVSFAAGARNLGKARSLGVCAANIAVLTALFTDECVRLARSSVGLAGSLPMLHALSCLLLGVMLLTVTAAKYADKAARGAR